MHLTSPIDTNHAPCGADRPSRFRFGRLSQRLRKDKSGAALIEFAVALPVLITLGMYGTELAYMATVNMEVSQLASSVADNASRLGQTDNSTVTPTVSETDIDSVMEGAIEQGSGIDFEQNGRIILSSLEQDSDTGQQYIHWQRCRGDLDKDSDYGTEGANLQGMGMSGRIITAPANSAVMYAEVYYNYAGLFGDMFVGDVQFKQEAALIVRDDRNLAPGVTGTGGSSNCTS
jgi:Flp pilus assembly pilin Flp